MIRPHNPRVSDTPVPKFSATWSGRPVGGRGVLLGVDRHLTDPGDDVCGILAGSVAGGPVALDVDVVAEVLRACGEAGRGRRRGSRAESGAQVPRRAAGRGSAGRVADAPRRQSRTARGEGMHGHARAAPRARKTRACRSPAIVIGGRRMRRARPLGHDEPACVPRGGVVRPGAAARQDVAPHAHRGAGAGAVGYTMTRVVISRGTARAGRGATAMSP
jgi:hypothetical protein